MANVFKKIGKGIKKVGKAIGRGWEAIDDYALPAVGFALGGPAGAAAGSAAARAIGDGKFNAKATLGAGLKGYAGGQLASAAGLAGGDGLRALGSSARSVLSNPLGAARGVMGGGAGGAGGAPMAGGGGVGGFLRENADLILGGVSAYQGAKAQGQADDYRKMALRQAEQQWAQGAPLREQGLSRMLSTPRPDLSQRVRYSDPRVNPFA